MASLYVQCKRAMTVFHVAPPEGLSAEEIDARVLEVRKEYDSTCDEDDDCEGYFIFCLEKFGFLVLEGLPYFGEE